MSTTSKRYVVVISAPSEANKRAEFRSVPMSLADATSQANDYRRDSVRARLEEANADDLAAEKEKKARAKERRAAKENTPKLFGEEWFARRDR